MNENPSCADQQKRLLVVTTGRGQGLKFFRRSHFCSFDNTNCLSLQANVNCNQLWRESKFCIWSPVPQSFCKHFTIVTIILPIQNLKSLPGQSCQFLLPVSYQYFTSGAKYIIILPMNCQYFTSQNKLHKITSILPKSLVKLLNSRTGKIMVKI